MIPNYSYSRFLVFVQALHFYFSVVINNSFNLIFETDLLLDSINSSFLRVQIKLPASPALHQAHPIISVIPHINARLDMNCIACVRLIQLGSNYFITNSSFSE